MAKYIGTGGVEAPPPATAFCRDRGVKIAANLKVQWNGWSPGTDNWRYQAADAAGLSLDAVKGLKLKVAFAFDGDLTAFAQPTILDNQLFVGSAGGVIHALDRETGCVRWQYEAWAQVRTSILAVRRRPVPLRSPVRRSNRHLLRARRREREAAVEEAVLTNTMPPA